MVSHRVELGPRAGQPAPAAAAAGDPATRPHEQGVLVIDDTGDRKAGSAIAHVARQYLGSLGKTDNGIVAVTSLWADERVYWPVHVVPYTPASRLPGGKHDSGFRTKPQLAVALVDAARQAGIGFRAVVADCLYGDNEGFTQALGATRVAFVLAVRPPQRGPDRRPTSPTRPRTRPASWPGPARPSPATGPRSRAGSATATPRAGGRPTRRCPRPAGVPTSPSGWWWRPPTRPPSRS